MNSVEEALIESLKRGNHQEQIFKPTIPGYAAILWIYKQFETAEDIVKMFSFISKTGRKFPSKLFVRVLSPPFTTHP